MMKPMGMPPKSMPAKMSGRDKVMAAFHEVKHTPPAVLAKTRKKSGVGQAGKQAVAIALSKARQVGAKIPYAGVKRS